MAGVARDEGTGACLFRSLDLLHAFEQPDEAGRVSLRLAGVPRGGHHRHRDACGADGGGGQRRRPDESVARASAEYGSVEGWHLAAST